MVPYSISSHAQSVDFSNLGWDPEPSSSFYEPTPFSSFLFQHANPFLLSVSLKEVKKPTTVIAKSDLLYDTSTNTRLIFLYLYYQAVHYICLYVIDMLRPLFVQ